MARRTARDWTADIGLFLFAAGFSLLTADAVAEGRELSGDALFYDQLAGAAGCAAVFLRRRWPVPLAVVLLAGGTVSLNLTGPTMVALFTVAAHRPPRVTRWVVLLAAAPLPVFLLRRPDPQQPATVSGIMYFLLVAVAIGWGLYVGSHRRLVDELRERAERAAAEARGSARAEIAREMHDVLAHRLSLLSVHAGALEFNPGAPEAQIRRTAGVIRDSAHAALEDLREVIGVLRSAPGYEGCPQPVLADLERLVAEARSTGTRVALERRGAEAAAVPAALGRTAYRVVQECLTNARKHAPDADVTVTLHGGPGDGLAVEVRNALPPGASPAAIPGAGHGLIGLAERASLAGGRLEHGPVDGDFRVRARLPWPATAEEPAGPPRISSTNC